jgi:hypothetical protein
MIVHGLIGSLCRLAANRIKGPIHLVQVDIRRQRAERPPLRYTALPTRLEYLLNQMENLRVLYPLGNFVQ